MSDSMIWLLAGLWGTGAIFASLGGGWATREAGAVDLGEVVLFGLFWPLIALHVLGGIAGNLADLIREKLNP